MNHHSKPTSSTGAFHASARKILIIEDESAISTSTVCFLSEAGYECVVAESLADARQTFGEGRSPDAVLLDINLPDGNGLDFLAEIRKTHPRLPVVMFTSEGFDEDRMQTALKHGASGFVSKYMDFDNIALAIRRALQG